MRRRYKANAAAAAPTATELASDGYPSEGEVASGTPATIPGPYWFHLVTEAIVTVIEEANLTLSDEVGQFLEALKIVAAAAVPDFATNAEAATGTATDKIINPANLKHVIDDVIDSAPGALDTLNELAAAIGDDANYAATVTAALALKAPLASPALTGNPTAPTQANSNDSTRLASTAFVKNVAIGHGQSWAGVTRNFGTNYQNNSDRPIGICFRQATGSGVVDLYVGPTSPAGLNVAQSGSDNSSMFVIIPPRHYYRFVGNNATATIRILS